MRVLYLHQYFGTPTMPSGTRSYEMARRLVRAGHSVRMVTSDQTLSSHGSRAWRVTEEAGIEVHWAPVRYSNSMGYGRRLLAFGTFAAKASLRATSLEGDVVFATSTPLTIAIPGVVAARLKRVPFVFEVRDLWPEVPIAVGALGNRIMLRYLAWGLQRFAYRNAAHIVALSPGMRDGIVARGYPARQVTVIPNGCDFDVFGIDGKAGRVLRERTAWLRDRPLVVHAGALGLANEVDFLVRVAHEAASLDPEVRFAIVGSGKQEGAIRNLASELGVLDVSVFMLGSKPKSEVAEWLSAADMACVLFGPNPAFRDSSSNKFFDALASGTPVIHRFDGYTAALAEEAGAGVTVSGDDPAKAAMDIVERLHDAAWLSSAGHAAFQLGRERFGRDDLAAQLERVLVEMVER